MAKRGPRLIRTSSSPLMPIKEKQRSKVEMHLDQMVRKGDSPTLIPLTDTDNNDNEESESEGDMEVVTNLILITLRSC